MARWHFGATKLDRRIADAVARNASPAVERPARLLTWVADEHLLFVISAGLWLASRAGDQRQRRQTDHLVLCAIVTAILPHLLKRLIDQKRPDRCMIHGRRHGIPRSGKAYDAFPSGHAMHVGALASAATVLPKAKRNLLWALSAGLALTRVVLLAHWASDVLAGLALGALTERLIRAFTGYGASANGVRNSPRPNQAEGCSFGEVTD
jgi:membrane-associated phospholipid phosphatase